MLSALCEFLAAAPMEDGDSVHRALVALGTKRGCIVVWPGQGDGRPGEGGVGGAAHWWLWAQCAMRTRSRVAWLRRWVRR